MDGDGGSVGDGGGGGGDGAPASIDGGTGPQAFCEPLPAPTNTISVAVADVANLQTIIEGATAGDTVLLANGTYNLAGLTLWFRDDGVSLRGESRDGVILDGGYQSGSIVNVAASQITIADLTIKNAYYHPVHVSPSAGRSITGTLLYNLKLHNPGEQAVKINTNGGGTLFADQGVVACSHLLLDDAGRPNIRNNCYTGGIDMHQGRGWVFRDNLVEGFWCQAGLSEHGIHLWRGGRDNVIERNVLRNNARGIGLGLGNDTSGRSWSDNPCGGAIAQDYAAAVRNNMIFADAADLYTSASGVDVGIGLESACNATVVHNTVFTTEAPFSSIEYRFATTSGVIANNLVSHNVRDRGQTTIAVVGNVIDATASWFVDATAGNLHLAETATNAIDKADAASAVAEDFDGDPRNDGSADVGADER